MTTEEIRKRLNLPESAKAAQEEGLKSMQLQQEFMKMHPVAREMLRAQVNRQRGGKEPVMINGRLWQVAELDALMDDYDKKYDEFVKSRPVSLE